MDLERTEVVLRERGPAELYDLAFLFCRRHARRIALLAVAGCAPWCALDWWLLSGGEVREWWRWYWLLVLAAAQIPVATAPLSAWLGAVMFEPDASARAALRAAWRRTPVLLLIGLWRGILALCPPLLLLWPPHIVEALLLEGQPFRATWRRAVALRGAWGGDWALHLIIGAVLLAAGMWVVIGSGEAVADLLLHGDPWVERTWRHWNPGTSPAPHLVLWAVIAFLATVRFLAYIDLRTRHEGWELGLRLKRAAERLGGGA
jgi:hypothetical protein